MPAVQELSDLFGLSSNRLSRDERRILEAELFNLICSELIKMSELQMPNYCELIKLNIEKECGMIDANFIRCIIRDILLTEEYTLTGIAYYSDIPEDVIYEVVIGQNASPSLTLSRKMIELHRSVRPSLYQNIIKKITEDKSSAA